MSEDRTKEDNAFDADQLAALARPSLPPTQDRDDDDDDDDGPLDLKALTASMVPPAASDEPADDDDDDSRVSVAAASGASSTSADSSSSAKVAGTKSSKGKSAKGKSAKSKSSKGKSSKGKSSGKSAEPKDDEKKAVAAAVEEPQSGGSGKMLIALIAVLGIGGVVFALTQNAEPEQQASLYPPASETTAAPREPARVEDTTPEETPEPAAADEAVEAPLPDETEGETEAEPATTEAAPAEAEPTGDRRARRRETSMTGAAATMENPEAADTTMEVAVAPSMEAETMAAEPTMEQSSSMDDMDDLLTRALGGTPSAGGTMTEATMEVAMEDRSSLPETPSRPAVTRALGGLMARMRQCAGDQVVMATARIRLNNNGQVVSANIGGSPFGGTPQGACMERVVQTARFPRFQRTHFDVTYPFSIRAIR